MKPWFALMPCLALAACAGGDPIPADAPLPVDMLYRVSVEQIENSCGVQDPPEDAYALVDVLLRSDVLHDVTIRSGYVPGPAKYEAVARQAGRVDHRTTWVSELSGETYGIRLSGFITRSRMDLALEYHGEKWGVSRYDHCLIKTRLVGAARPISDPAAYDGAYAIGVSSFGFGCSQADHAPAGRFNTVMRVEQNVPDRLEFVQNDLFGWQLPPPGADGALDWNGTIFVFIPSYSQAALYLELDGGLNGVFKPDDADLRMDYAFQDTPAGCAFVDMLKGRKRIPALTRADNDYRMRFDVHDPCTGGGDFILEAPVEILTQPDGRIELKEFGFSTSLTDTAGALAYSAGSEAEGETITYTGKIAPPRLDYAVEYRVLKDGDWCTATYTAAGQVRFVFPE